MVFWTALRAKSNRSASMSIRHNVVPSSRGKVRMSRVRLRVKTVLPAPMKVIFVICESFIKWMVVPEPLLDLEEVQQGYLNRRTRQRTRHVWMSKQLCSCWRSATACAGLGHTRQPTADLPARAGLNQPHVRPDRASVRHELSCPRG